MYDNYNYDESNAVVDQLSDEKKLSISDDGTFTALQKKIDDAAEGSTIILENDYTYDDGFEGDIEGVHFTKTLKVDGKGHTIDGLNNSRILLVSAPNITFSNLVLKNGYVNGSGAAFYTHYDNTNFVNCTFINNYAESEGGAVYSSGVTSINKCQFIGNNAYDGGAVYSNYATFIINNSYFKNNNASYGGAVSLDRSYDRWSLNSSINNAMDSFIYASVFENNSASSGGAIYSLHILFIDNSSFKKNHADEGYGGAIYTSNGYVYYSTLTLYSYGVPYKTITTPYIQNFGLVISGSSLFENNSADENGGAIYISSNDFAFSEDVKNNFIIDGNVVFDSNYAFRGGAIAMYSALASINNTLFKNNFVDWDGGAILARDISELTVTNSKFINNNATDYGGSICSQYMLNVSNSNFTGTQDLDFIDYYNYYDNETPYGNMFLENNKMLANNTYDIWYEGQYTLNFPLYLVFLNKTAHSDDNVVIAEVQDKNGNSIRMESLNVNFTNVKTSKIKNMDVDFNSSIGYAINASSLEKGIYNVRGVISEYSADYSIIDGKLVINDFILSASDITKYYGGNQKYTVTFTDNGQAVANANIKFSVGGKTYYAKTNSNGQASIDLNLTVGNYDVESTYEDVSANSKVYVKSTIDIKDASGTYKNSKVSATFLNTDGKPLSNTKVTFKVGSNDYTATTDSNGLAVANVDLGAGTYTVTATNPVNNEKKTGKLTISKAKTSISLVSGENKGEITLTASLTPAISSGNVIFNVNNKNHTVKITNSKATLTLNDLNLGNYTAYASYAGDSNFNPSNANIKFKVTKLPTEIIYSDMDTAPVTSKDGRIGNYFVVKLVDKFNNPLAGLPIQIGFNGKIYDRNTSSNGVAKLQINLPREDIYTFAICFLGDDDYIGSFEVAKITVDKKNPKPNKAGENSTGTAVNLVKTVNKIKTSISYSDMNTVSVLSVDGRIGKYFIVKFLDNNGKALSGLPIQIGFNGKIYDRTTDDNGEAKLQINLLRPTLYTFAIAYLGNNLYKGSFAVAKITVKAQSPKLTASAKTFKASAKTKSVSATLLSANKNPIKGKQIIFTINGKSYTGTTNSKGVATVNISLNKKGTYSCTVKFAGMNGCTAKTIRTTVQIK